MKLTEIQCEKCGFNQWDVSLKKRDDIHWQDDIVCPNCGREYCLIVSMHDIKEIPF